MSEIDALQDAFMKADALAQQGDKTAAQDAAMFASEIKRLQSGSVQPAQQGQMMRQVNRGIADTVGGLVDFINPFDEPHALNPFEGGTGSAREGLKSGMERVGIDVAEGDPQTAGEAFQRGMGEAAGAIIPVMKGLSALRGMGGSVGKFADDAYRSLASLGAGATETVAGGLSRGAEKGAENMGAPEWVQQTAAIAAPMGAAAVIPAAAAVGRVGAKYSPGAQVIKQGVRNVKAAVAPYTEGGAYEVARNRMQGLAGGPERAQRLSDRIDIDNEYRLTPAQQTDDPNMRGLERLAAEQDPNLRERLEVRAETGRNIAQQDVAGMGGDVQEARAFIAEQRRAFKTKMDTSVNDALKRAGTTLDNIKNIRPESENATAAMDEVRKALDSALVEEKAMWDAIPRGARVPTMQTTKAAQELVEAVPFAQRDSVPKAVRDVLDNPEVYGDEATINNMHGLYSELRRVARSAMAGSDQDKKMAKIANEVADAVLDDMGANGGVTEIGRKINAARENSRVLHETFDRGTVGRLLKRTIDGDTTVAPELAMKRSVGRQGVEASVAANDLGTATQNASDPFVTDYIKERFNKAAVSANGDFTQASARKFIRDNAELLERYPDLRTDIKDAVAANETAEAFAARVQGRIKTLEDGRRSAAAAFLNGPADKAFKAIIDSANPAQAARKLANAARKDTSGKALAGVKGAFTDHLIENPEDLARVIDDTKVGAAMRQVFEPGELQRMRVIGREMQKLSAAGEASNIGTSLSGAKPNSVLKFMLTTVAARHGAALGAGTSGASLKTASAASDRMSKILDSLVSDKAAKILSDAIEDPELFKALLTDTASPTIEKRVLPRLVPYLVGTGAAQAEVE